MAALKHRLAASGAVARVGDRTRGRARLGAEPVRVLCNASGLRPSERRGSSSSGSTPRDLLGPEDQGRYGLRSRLRSRPCKSDQRRTGPTPVGFALQAALRGGWLYLPILL